MFDLRVMSVVGAVLIASAGTAAHAQTSKKAAEFSVRAEPSAAAQGGKSLKLDTRKGRWGVTLGLEQQAERGVELKDVQAGAYFRVTPSLRVGGAVALGDDDSYRKVEPKGPAPRVRLETAFKF
jgi:hypothetical protein